MFKLLNRFAWLIAIAIWFQFSLLVDRDGPFDDEGFWMFLIVTLLVKFVILSNKYITSRLDFFAQSLSKNYLWTQSSTSKELKVSKNISETQATSVGEKKSVSSPIQPIQKTQKVKRPSRLMTWVKKFFSENLLAKLWSIFVFLGVLFLLWLVYSYIGPVGKLMIGFAIWVLIYFSWVWLDSKKYYNEWRILLWAWILINYLVILSGRFLIWDGAVNFLSEGTTFLFLILNTLFAVLTSLVYKSRTLLLFSFIFAFLNPFLIWGSSDNPYTLSGYALIVSLGGLFLARKQKDVTLWLWVFFLANIVFLAAPFSTDIHWITKLIFSAFISLLSIATLYKIDTSKLSSVFVWSYIFLMLLLWTWESYIQETTSFISYMITIAVYFWVWIYYFLKTSFSSLVYILAAPIFILLWLGFTGWLSSIIFALAIIVGLYLIGFTFIQEKLPNFLKYFFFIILWIYIFCSNALLTLDSYVLEISSFITVLIISFLFIFSSYYLSTKKNLEFLYGVWTIWWALILAPILVVHTFAIDASFIEWSNIASPSWLHVMLSIISVIIFALSHWLLPFVNNSILSQTKNLVISMILWILFIWFQLFSFWEQYFPWVMLWIAFALLAIIYFIMAYIMMEKIWMKTIRQNASSKNTLYSYLWISISVFSLAIALIFSNYEAIISSIWLFEATILFYFFAKTKETKIYSAWIILLLIWVIQLFDLVDIVQRKDFLFLIPFSLIAISFILNIKYLDFVESISKRIFHDILHLLWIAALWIMLLEIIPSTGHGWSILGISIFISCIAYIYSIFQSPILKWAFVVMLTLFWLIHFWESDSIMRRIDRANLEHLRVLQYISTALLWWAVIVWNKYNTKKLLNGVVNIIFGIYFLAITSWYVYDIFDTTFAITIYWWVFASILLFHWLSKDIIKLRTLWLYLIMLTTLKIWWIDIWIGMDDTISRVVALIVIWILLIIISTKYSKKIWNNISKEFSLSNLTNTKTENKVQRKNKKIVNRKIERMNTGNISSVQFIIWEQQDKVTIRAVNLVKIVQMVVTKYGKTKFYKYELNEIYKMIKHNYESDLPKDQYNKIIEIIERFIDEGWEVKLIEKK